MYISRLELKNWKNFTAVDVNLSEKTIIVGPNAAGKSNLLDAIRFLRDVVKQGGGLQQAVVLRGGVSMLRSQAARRYSRIKIAIELSENSQRLWRYELEFTQEGGGVRQTFAVVKDEILINIKTSKKLYKFEQNDNTLDQFTVLERPDKSKEFIEFIQFFQGIQYLHIVPQLVRDPRSYIVTNNVEDFFGRNFIKHIAILPERQSSLYLRNISEFLKVAVPGFQEMHLDRDVDGEPHIAVKFKTWRPQGANQNEAQLSDGTLRLIGLLWALQYGTKPVLLEEPELSLHPEIVKRLYTIISRLQKNSKRKRQVILTTHSHDFLADQAIQADEVILLESMDGFTNAQNIDSDNDLKLLLKNGFNVAELVLPKAAPKDIKKIDDQLNLFN